MSRRASRAAASALGRRLGSAYGRFTGTEFVMSATESQIHDHRDLAGWNASVATGDLALRRPIQQSSIDSETAPADDMVSTSDCSASDYASPTMYRGNSAVVAAISLAPTLRDKRIPYRARAYMQRHLLEELSNVNNTNFTSLLSAVSDLRLANRDLIRAYLGKLEELHAASDSADDKQRLAEASLQISTMLCVKNHASSRDIKRCLSVLRSSLACAPDDARLRVAMLYATLLPTGLVENDELGDVISSLMRPSTGVRQRMTLADCASTAELLSVARAYVLAAGEGWTSDPRAARIRKHVETAVLPEVELHVNVFTAAQLADVLSFLAVAWPASAVEAGALTRLLEACCDRFVRDVAQFSVTTMLSFHASLLTLGHRSDRAIIAMILTLPRRAQSLSCVDQLISLIRIACATGAQSAYLRDFVSEQALQLAHKVGQPHVAVLQVGRRTRLGVRGALLHPAPDERKQRRPQVGLALLSLDVAGGAVEDAVQRVGADAVGPEKDQRVEVLPVVNGQHDANVVQPQPESHVEALLADGRVAHHEVEAEHAVADVGRVPDDAGTLQVQRQAHVVVQDADVEEQDLQEVGGLQVVGHERLEVAQHHRDDVRPALHRRRVQLRNPRLVRHEVVAEVRRDLVPGAGGELALEDEVVDEAGLDVHFVAHLEQRVVVELLVVAEECDGGVEDVLAGLEAPLVGDVGVQDRLREAVLGDDGPLANVLLDEVEGDRHAVCGLGSHLVHPEPCIDCPGAPTP
ncbi:riboflavin kinase, putative [Babesia caballi]|uniref:Riboflavin kinase, putative n=1 Tax=Babesia caballi TaxID=5871 RepID=A0AAV4LUV1_BABCB|nr:riboflavin kinase, putative [Babesia caballi]